MVKKYYLEEMKMKIGNILQKLEKKRGFELATIFVMFITLIAIGINVLMALAAIFASFRAIATICALLGVVMAALELFFIVKTMRFEQFKDCISLNSIAYASIIAGVKLFIALIVTLLIVYTSEDTKWRGALAIISITEYLFFLVLCGVLWFETGSPK